MEFTHERSHGGKSSAKLVYEASELHKRLVYAALDSPVGSWRRGKCKRAMSRAYTRFLRRDVRLARRRSDAEYEAE